MAQQRGREAQLRRGARIRGRRRGGAAREQARAREAQGGDQALHSSSSTPRRRLAWATYGFFWSHA